MKGCGSAKTKFQDLPCDIVFGSIFLLLPIKTLGQMRCVCKLWCTKIDSPHFINSHLTHASQKSTYLYSVWKDPDGVRLRLMGEDDVNCYKLKTICVVPDINMPHRCLIYNSCHGLICYTTAFGVERASDGGLPISVCNPITGESINLPEFTSSQGLVYTPCSGIILKEEGYYWEFPDPLTCRTISYPKDGSGINTTAAIGFNPLTKEYKVVVLFHHWVDSVMTWLTLDGGVYSLSSKSWTRISKPPIYAPKDDHPAVWLNGALHWVTDTPPHECIMSFDLRDDQFYILAGPPLCSSTHEIRHLFPSVAGSLAVICRKKLVGNLLPFDEDLYKKDVWLLKDYKNNIWNKVLTISTHNPIRGLGVWRKEEMLLDLQSEVSAWDLSSRTNTTIEHYQSEKKKFQFIFSSFTFFFHLLEASSRQSKIRVYQFITPNYLSWFFSFILFFLPFCFNQQLTRSRNLEFMRIPIVQHL